MSTTSASLSGVNPDLTNDDIMKGVIPYLEANYMVSKDAKDRAIAGQSRGAAQTFAIARKHPGAFAYVGVFSFSRSRVGGFRKEMEAMKSDADWKAFGDMVDKHKYFYWTVGNEDGGAPDSKKVWELYKPKNINVVTETRRGQSRMAGVAPGAARFRAEGVPVDCKRAPVHARRRDARSSSHGGAHEKHRRYRDSSSAAGSVDAAGRSRQHDEMDARPGGLRAYRRRNRRRRARATAWSRSRAPGKRNSSPR